MERRTKFTDEELDHIHIINVFEFDLIKSGNGLSFGQSELLWNWRLMDRLGMEYAIRHRNTRGFKIYSIYPDIDLYNVVNNGLHDIEYFTWDSNSYHYAKKE